MEKDHGERYNTMDVEASAIRRHGWRGRTIKTIINKTRRPIRISLPRGKTLHLGPAGQGQVHDDALERPALKKLIAAGEVEVIDENDHPEVPEKTWVRTAYPSRGHRANQGRARGGDR